MVASGTQRKVEEGKEMMPTMESLLSDSLERQGMKHKPRF